MSGPSHFDERGNPHMVDVSAKSVTRRVAVAVGRIDMSHRSRRMIESRGHEKGDVIAVATIAAIGGAKQTATLIPLCHAIAIESVQVEFDWPRDQPADRSSLRCTATVRTSGKTGVEMEAMTAVCVAGLTVYDMLKGTDRSVTIGRVELKSKRGGKTDYQA